jgi:hypothetical protein
MLLLYREMGNEWVTDSATREGFVFGHKYSHEFNFFLNFIKIIGAKNNK